MKFEFVKFKGGNLLNVKEIILKSDIISKPYRPRSSAIGPFGS